MNLIRFFRWKDVFPYQNILNRNKAQSLENIVSQRLKISEVFKNFQIFLGTYPKDFQSLNFQDYKRFPKTSIDSN